MYNLYGLWAFHLRLEWSGERGTCNTSAKGGCLCTRESSVTNGISELRAPSLQHKGGCKGMGLLGSSLTLTVRMSTGECAVASWWQPNYFLLFLSSLRFWSCVNLELHCLNWFYSIMQSLHSRLEVMCSWRSNCKSIFFLLYFIQDKVSMCVSNQKLALLLDDGYRSMLWLLDR